MNEEKKLTNININWYPGHMVKAQNEIKNSLKLIDIFIEILDARIPISSRNPLIDKLAEGKARIIILNKSDLADDIVTKNWKEEFERQGYTCIVTNAASGYNIKELIEKIKEIGNKIYSEKYKDKNIKINHLYRVLIAGIPNVGKSTIINKISGKNSANVSNKPGVTKKNQWIRMADNIELLDTPGLLWPKFEDENVGINLALTGNIKQEILDVEELACIAIDKLVIKENYKNMLKNKYKLVDNDFDNIAYDILEIIGRKRGCLIKGGNVDMQKSAKLFLDEFKMGKVGKISLE